MATPKMVQCDTNALIIRSLPVIGISTDTGKRMIKGQTSEVYGVSIDKQWLYVAPPAGRGWCSKNFLSEVSEDISPFPTSWPKVPRGRDEIVRIFGSAGNPLCSAGRVMLPSALTIGWTGKPTLSFACHKLMEDVFSGVFFQIMNRGLWDSLETFDGVYNDRTVTGSQKISTHAWGIAIDLNAATNRVGMIPRIDREVVAIFKDHGFVWGGDWNRPDGMHFQYATGY
jgi:hypothetical protein